MIYEHDACPSAGPASTTPLGEWNALAERIGQITSELEISAGLKPWTEAELGVADREAMAKTLDQLAAAAVILRNVVRREAAS
jgi:hypothetical protein